MIVDKKYLVADYLWISWELNRSAALRENRLLQHLPQLNHISGPSTSPGHRTIKHNDLQLGGCGMDTAVARRVSGRCIYRSILDDPCVCRHLPSGKQYCQIFREPSNLSAIDTHGGAEKCVASRAIVK